MENTKTIQEDTIRLLDILKKENQKYLDAANIISLDSMSTQFIDKYMRKRKLIEINGIK